MFVKSFEEFNERRGRVRDEIGEARCEARDATPAVRLSRPIARKGWRRRLHLDRRSLGVGGEVQVWTPPAARCAVTALPNGAYIGR